MQVEAQIIKITSPSGKFKKEEFDKREVSATTVPKEENDKGKVSSSIVPVKNYLESCVFGISDFKLGLYDELTGFVTVTHFKEKTQDENTSNEIGEENNNKQKTVYVIGFRVKDAKEDDVEFELSSSKNFTEKLDINPFIIDNGDTWYINYNPQKPQDLTSKDISKSSVGYLVAGNFYVRAKIKSTDKKKDKEQICSVFVAPSTVSVAHYNTMLEDLMNIRYDLIVGQGKQSIAFENKHESKTNSVEKSLEQIRKGIDKIEKALQNIVSNPSYELVATECNMPLEKIHKFNFNFFRDYVKNPRKQKFKSIVYCDTLDIYENRVIKAAILRLKERLESLISHRKNTLSSKNRASQRSIIKFVLPYLKIVNPNAENVGLNDLDNLISLFENKNYSEDFKQKLICVDRSFKETMDITLDVIKMVYETYEPCCYSSGSCIKTYWTKVLDELNEYKDKPLLIRNRKYIKGEKELDIPNPKYGINFCFENIGSEGYKRIKKQLCDEECENSTHINLHLEVVKSTFLQNHTIEVVRVYEVDDNKIEETDEDIYLSHKKLIDDLKHAKLILNKVEQDKNNLSIAVLSTYQNLIDRLVKLENCKIIKDVQPCFERMKLTQRFANDSDYFIVYREFEQLLSKLCVSPDTGKDKLVQSTPNLYEYWLFFKMIYLLIENFQFEIEGGYFPKKYNFRERKKKYNIIADEKTLSKDNIISIIDCIFNNKIRDNIEGLEVKLKRVLSGTQSINVTIKYNTVYYLEEFDENKEYEKEKPKVNPDYWIEIYYSDKPTEKYNFIIDAKYKDWVQMGENSFAKDLYEVAIDKYLQKLGSKACNSFIVHPDSREDYTYYGSYRDEKIYAGLANSDVVEFASIGELGYPGHKFGAFCMIPGHDEGFLLYLKLIMEYFVGCNNSVCWNCGSNAVFVEEKPTQGGHKKYKYNCPNCGDEWIITKCTRTKASERHTLIKHFIGNYHKNVNDGDNMSVVCPRCGDVLENVEV